MYKIACESHVEFYCISAKCNVDVYFLPFCLSVLIVYAVLVADAYSWQCRWLLPIVVVTWSCGSLPRSCTYRTMWLFRRKIFPLCRRCMERC